MDRLRRALATRRRRLAAAVVVLVAAVASATTVAVVGATASDQPGLRPSGGVGLSTRNDVPFATFELGDLCSRTDHPAELVQVEALATRGGASVTDFSVDPYGAGEFIIDKERLRDVPGYSGNRMVRTLCSDEQLGQSTLSVEVHRPGAEDAVVNGLRLWYRDGDGLRSVDDPDVELAICGATPDTDTSCLD